MAGVAPPVATRNQSPENMTGQVDFESNPQSAEGFLMDSAGIINVITLDEDSYRGGETSLYEYEMTDGNRYYVRSNRPDSLRSDIGVVSTTPWTTRAGGFNNDNMSSLNELGYQTDFVEPRGKAIRASLPDSALHLELIAADRHSKSELRPDETLYFGASRAAAIGFGVKSAVYADLLAPCFPVGCKPNQLPKAVSQLGVEAIELGRHITKLGLGRLAAQHTTFSKHPMDVAHTVLTIPKLINGDAGRLAWSNPHRPTHITLLDKDGWSQPSSWDELAAERPNMHVSRLQGRHMTLARQDIIDAAMDRFDTLAEMRGFDGSIEDIDFEQIWKIQPAEPKKLLGGLSISTFIKAGYNIAAKA